MYVCMYSSYYSHNKKKCADLKTKKKIINASKLKSSTVIVLQVFKKPNARDVYFCFNGNVIFNIFFSVRITEDKQLKTTISYFHNMGKISQHGKFQLNGAQNLSKARKKTYKRALHWLRFLQRKGGKKYIFHLLGQLQRFSVRNFDNKNSGK